MSLALTSGRCSRTRCGRRTRCSDCQVHVLHETDYPQRFPSRCYETLCPGGKLLLIEPTGQVSEQESEADRRLALEIGFSEVEGVRPTKSRAMVLAKPPRQPAFLTAYRGSQ